MPGNRGRPRGAPARPRRGGQKRADGLAIAATAMASPAGLATSAVYRSLVSLQAYLFERRRPGVGIDQHQRRLLDPRADPARPDVVPDRAEPHPLVDELLDLVQQRLALAAIGHERLLLVERVDVGIAAVGVGAGTGDVLDRKSTRLNSSHVAISYAVFCLNKKI